jgi:Zn-dependent metalloprotease
VLAAAGPAAAEPGAADPAAVEALRAETGGEVALDSATGTVRFLRLPPEPAGLRAQGSSGPEERRRRAAAFLGRHARAFGLHSADRGLVLVSEAVDSGGRAHLAFEQRHAGVPVFGALLRVHFDPGDALSVVNGRLVPGIDVDPAPSRSAEDAAATALAAVAADTAARDLAIHATELLVYREGLVQGVPGASHLAFEVEVGNGADVRELVYVDAHTGKVIDQITGIHDGLDRRVYDAEGRFAPGPNYPDRPFWQEGDAHPTGNAEADELILASGESYDLFWNAFGRDAWDGAGAALEGVFARGDGCPNASWNGTFTSYCPGLVTDDVTAHEWGHAYTQGTHDLIYAWQPGALNEAYSDIWGELVDLTNGRGADAPDTPRTEGACSMFSGTRGELVVDAPAHAAAVYPTRLARFGPGLPPEGTRGFVVRAQDGAGSPTDACEPLTNPEAVAGAIALVDRGNCEFATKVLVAQQAGAIAVIVANDASAGLPPMGNGADAPFVAIPSAGVSHAAGLALEAALADGLHATLGAPGLDGSRRWLLAEESGLGAIRDMWEPTCHGDPGRVGDTERYYCLTSDSGGVHINSGVPNHAFALLVDGGTYAGRAIGAIGATRAAHIYWRAQSVYQTRTSGFPDHADALEAACADLVGQPLADPATGVPSGEVVRDWDCAQVAEAVRAVELRTVPEFCHFGTVLAPDPPDRCDPATTAQADVFAEDFEAGAPGWATEHMGVYPEFTPRDWVVTTDLPRREGAAAFAPDPNLGTCRPGGDESGVLYLSSPEIALPAGAAVPLLSFDHSVSTERLWDGGNLQIRVGGGDWVPVDAAAFRFNPYNLTLRRLGSNPLAGQPAWSGFDQGDVAGAWSRSLVDLSGWAGPGDRIQLRFAFGTDCGFGVSGWSVDDVTVYACPSNQPPGVSVNDLQVIEGDRGPTQAVFTVSLSHASALPVQVRYRLDEGTARRGRDFIPADIGGTHHTALIPPLALSAAIPVWIHGDRQPEGDEAFAIRLLDPVHATLADASGTVTILDDDR